MQIHQRRWLHLDTPLGADVFTVLQFRGTEALSEPFRYRLLAESSVLNLDVSRLLGRGVSLRVGFGDTAQRFHGLVSQISPGAVDVSGRRQYELVLSPWFALLEQVRDCRGFRSLSVPEIFQRYCQDLGFYDFDLRGLRERYTPRDYQVQYGESAAQFLTRLLAEAGIDYYVEQRADKHILALTDTLYTLPLYPTVVPYSPEGGQGAHLWRWQASRRLQVAQVRQPHYRFTRRPLTVWQSQSGRHSVEQTPAPEHLSQLCYPPHAETEADGEARVNRLARGLRGRQACVQASGQVPGLYAGLRFRLGPIGRKPGGATHLIVALCHEADDPGAHARSHDSASAPSYRQHLRALPCDHLDYAPTPPPAEARLAGLQRARVLGNATHSVHTDEHARVQAHFPWAHRGESAPWLRVGHAWAGAGFGHQFIPRPEETVLVTGLAGDVEQPYILNSLPQPQAPALQKPAAPPGQTWIKSQTLGSQDPTQGNHLLFDDTPNQQSLRLHAQKNLRVDILNDLTHQVQGNETLRIDGHHQLTLQSAPARFQARRLYLSGGGSTLCLDEQGVTLKGSALSGGRVDLLTRGAGPSFPLARQGDPHQCPKREQGIAHEGGAVLHGAEGIQANGFPIARLGDAADCRIGQSLIQEGIASLQVGGQPAARVGHGLNHGGAITAGSPNVFVGEKPTVPNVYTQLQTEPITLLVLHLCDVANETAPRTQAPALAPLLRDVSASAIFFNVAGEAGAQQRLSMQGHQLIIPFFKPETCAKLYLRFYPGPAFHGQRVNIIAVNNTPLPHPVDQLMLTPETWQAQASTRDAKGNTYYHLDLTLLQPALLFNFRQDQRLQEVEQDPDAHAAYTAVRDYFASAPAADVSLRDTLSEAELNYFRHNGGNATVFIHGYNVETGAFAPAYQWDLLAGKAQISDYASTLYQDEVEMKAVCGDAFTADVLKNASPQQKLELCNGSGAHRWLVCMEYNLNRAAGFDGKDYRKYSRLILINWQGNPALAYDYMAAPALAPFAAQKTFRLLRQLQEAGLKINLMAHSLGCDVLSHTLDLCGQHGVTVDHAFLWEAALPNNALASTARWYFPMPDKNQLQTLDPRLPYSYNFPHAQHGANAFTVLYSQQDNILGPMEDGTPEPLGSPSAARAALRFLHKAWQDYHALRSGTHNDDTHIAMLAAKLRDPAAGWIYAMVADMVDLLDQYLVPLSHTHRKLCSIYHLANLYTFPFSWFLQDIAARSEAFFQSWRVAYKDSGWQQVVDGKAHKQLFSATWAQQIEKLRETYPQTFKFFQMCVREYQDIREGKHYYWKHPINTCHYMFTFPLLYPSYALAKTLGLAFAQDYAQKLAGNPLVQALEQHHESLVAVILLGLLTPDAVPRPALGWKGAAPGTIPANRYKEINQKKLLPDHSGMLVPKEDLFDEIYVGQLMEGTQGQAFKYFGKYKPA